MGQLTCPNCGGHNVRIVRRLKGYSTHKCVDCIDNTVIATRTLPDGTTEEIKARPGGYEFSVMVGATVDPNDDATIPG